MANCKAEEKQCRVKTNEVHSIGIVSTSKSLIPPSIRFFRITGDNHKEISVLIPDFTLRQFGEIWD